MIGELGSVPSGPRHGRAGLSGAGKQNFRFVVQLRLQQAATPSPTTATRAARLGCTTTTYRLIDGACANPRYGTDRATPQTLPWYK